MGSGRVSPAAAPAANGGQLMHLSVALCVLNDTCREAERLGIEVDGVAGDPCRRVGHEAQGDVGPVGVRVVRDPPCRELPT